MNVLLFNQSDKSSEGTYKVSGKDFKHLIKVLKLEVGATVFAGEINAKMGHCPILKVEEDHLILKANFDIDPPAQTPIILIIALPRPKMLRRIFRSISMLGVKEIYLINTYKVEKSFWHSNLLDPEKYEEYFTQGLSQSKDTILPKLHIRNKFKPFVEDELAAIIKKTNALVAHPGDYPAFPQGSSEPMSLAIGPEGGFTEYEIGKLQEAGFKAVHCGSRILRMETAVVSLISQHSSFLK